MNYINFSFRSFRKIYPKGDRENDPSRQTLRKILWTFQKFPLRHSLNLNANDIKCLESLCEVNSEDIYFY